jgi:hypothetical protein
MSTSHKHKTVQAVSQHMSQEAPAALWTEDSAPQMGTSSEEQKGMKEQFASLALLKHKLHV